MRSNRLSLTIACALAVAAPALAVDRWESAVPGAGDDTRAGTTNELMHGAVQSNHDFDGPGDLDWAIVKVQRHHSYEVRVSGGTAVWYGFVVPPAPICTVCGTLQVVTASGGHIADGNLVSGWVGDASTAVSARWDATSDEQLFVRVSSGGQAGVNYDLEFRDTTYRLPRFNNAGTQVTVLLVQNTSTIGIGAVAHFFSAAGDLLHSELLPLLLGGTSLVLNTAAIPALQGMSGHALIVHRAPYGTLAGKAVALDPATGFALDTPLEPIAY